MSPAPSQLPLQFSSLSLWPSPTKSWRIFFSVVLVAAVTILTVIPPLIAVSSEACPGSSSSSPCGSGTQCSNSNPCTPSTFSCCYTTDDGTCYSFCAHPDSDDHPGPNWSLPALVEREVPHLSWCQTEILCLYAPVESGLTALPIHWLCLITGNWTYSCWAPFQGLVAQNWFLFV